MPDEVWSLNTDRTGPIWCWFDPDRYARNDAAAAAATNAGSQAAIEDYRRRGELLGYAPNLFFDPVFYRAAYPDVAATVGTAELPTVFDHYCNQGWRDRDPHWLFSSALYAYLYKDLTPDIVAPLGGLYGHFLRAGAREGRYGHHLFDSGWYARRIRSGAPLDDVTSPFEHFLASLETSYANGTPEPLGSLYYDPVWYRATYADVARTVDAGRFHSALQHYVSLGAGEGRDPLCDFSEAEYLAANPDVDASVRTGGFRCGYEHFLSFGVGHLRAPCSHVDLAWYADQPSVARDMATGRFANPYAHMLAVGIPTGLPLLPPPPLDFALDEAAGRAAFVAQARRTLPSLGRHPLDFGYEGEPDISVIMVLRNQFALTMQSLVSLRSTFAGKIQLLIVDNGSTDGSAQITELVLGAQITRRDDNIGFLRACNMALPAASAPAVLYLNNDVVLHAGAIGLALARLAADRTVGAVGAKIIRTHGLLQEAGCLLWRDGSADGWMRGALPDAPEANYVREVDYCSGAFLMVRGDLLRSLQGFDDVYAPAYYEETDLCLRIRAAGYRVMYDPSVALTHYEYGSSRSLRAATALMLANRSKLRKRHAPALRQRLADRGRMAEAAAFASRGRRVLFIEDTVPLRRLGSGYGRAFDVMEALAAAGWQVTVFPMHPVRAELHQITASVSDTVEVMWDRDHRTLTDFLAGRYGYYDMIWISRAHNLRAFQDATGQSFAGIERAALVLDTEAVFSVRDASRAKLEGGAFDMERALASEFQEAWQCDHVVAVSAAEAELIRTVPLTSVSVVGFSQTPYPTPKSWDERHGMLHVGALTVDTAPNVDGLRWFMRDIHPQLEELVGKDAARLTVAGFAFNELDLSWLTDHPSVTFLGAVADLTPLYDASRVFIAPTRFAAGAPTKVLDAVSHGLPVVATDLLAGQLRWTDGMQLLSAAVSDAAGFARRAASLLTGAEQWNEVRAAGLKAIAVEFNPARFADQLSDAVACARRKLRRPPA